MKTFVLPLALLLGSALIAQDQPRSAIIAPYPHPWDQLQQYLLLTDPQVTALEQIRSNRVQQEQAVYREISEKQRQMWDLLQQGSNDALAIGRLMVDINNLQRQVPLRGDTYRAEVLAQLNPAQRAKLSALSGALSLQSAAWQAIELNMIDNPVVPDSRMLPVPLDSISAAGPNQDSPAARNIH